MKKLFLGILVCLLVPAAQAQTPPSGWVVAIGDLLAWYPGTEVQFVYQKSAPSQGSIFGSATAARYGRDDIVRRTSIMMHLLCDHDLLYCGKVFSDLQLDFAHPLPFGQPAPDPSLVTTPPAIPSPGPLPFGGTPIPPPSPAPTVLPFGGNPGQ